jgi:hypothetical protein
MKLLHSVPMPHFTILGPISRNQLRILSYRGMRSWRYCFSQRLAYSARCFDPRTASERNADIFGFEVAHEFVNARDLQTPDRQQCSKSALPEMAGGLILNLPRAPATRVLV